MSDAITRRNRDRDRLAVAGASDVAAFANAGRHTGRVRVLRRGILIFCSVTVVLGAVIALFDPFSRLKSMSIGGVGLQGTKISIDSPRVSGHRKDGMPYEIRAARGIQDITVPDVIELVRLDAKVGMTATTSVRVTANQGFYNSTKDEMQLTGLVRIQSDPAYDMKTESALIELKSGVLTSKQPVRVLLQSGSIDAESMQVIEAGQKVVFEGNVHSIMLPEGQRTEVVGMLKGTAQ